MEFGVLLPHCGDYAEPQKLLKSVQKLEEWGFDSLWVRDHLVWKPHSFEGKARTFIDAVVSLSAIAAVTSKVKLGTAVMIPIRWPLKVAQDLASLSYISGGRLEWGMGMGGNPTELGSAGFTVEERAQVFAETVEICKLIWKEDNVSYKGEKFSFENVTIQPKPPQEVPVWYGGSTQASIRRAFDCCDGWMPGRLPMATLDKRLAYMKEQSAAAYGGKQLKVGVIPVMNIGSTKEKAREGIDIEAFAHSSEGSVHWVKPPSGEFKTFEDFEGALITGSPDDCVQEIRKFKERNVDLFVFDLRLQFDKFDEKMELIAKEVLPNVQ